MYLGGQVSRKVDAESLTLAFLRLVTVKMSSTKTARKTPTPPTPNVGKQRQRMREGGDRHHSDESYCGTARVIGGFFRRRISFLYFLPLSSRLCGRVSRGRWRPRNNDFNDNNVIGRRQLLQAYKMLSSFSPSWKTCM